MRKHGGTPSRRDKHVTLAAISPPGVARGRFIGGQQSGLAGCKPPPLFTRGASSCSSQGRRQGEPRGASPRPSAPTYLPLLVPPGERSTGRPSPPPIPGRHFSPNRTRTPEGNAPATRRGPGWSTAGRRPEGEQGGRGATPPHRPASRGGPGPHPPTQGGWSPPARERSRSATRPPAPAAGSHGGREEQASPRLRTGTPRRSYPENPGEHKPEWYGGPRPPWTAQL